ncbi:MAG: U32 family peptidase [Oscillospiraceae bacterium]|nr:U32 family peptidase [Oscillospiraceae bacterium]
MTKLEILAPAGSPESLTAAVRCGANAVYFGVKCLNARRGAKNFEKGEIIGAVKYCRARGVKAYLTLNTLLTDNELPLLLNVIKSACEAGIDAVIAQDPAVLDIVKKHAPSLPLFASTQMGVHNLEGAKALEAQGFSRVILAREMSAREIRKIADAVSIELECFVHGALCMSLSGQCYLSAMIGGRSGNRGLCAQPCRLPMQNNRFPGTDYALSLKDLSLIEKIPKLIEAGVTSIKIEGRMKRPEYVAAAVTACKLAADGKPFNMAELEAVFSRSGFTSAFFDGNPGAHMFGRRTKDNVTAASHKLLHRVAAYYKNENPLVPVEFLFFLKRGEPAKLTVRDKIGNTVTVTGKVPGDTKTAPITAGKAQALLSKTGGTPFYPDKFTFEIEDGLILTAAAINALRREALDKLPELREAVKPHNFTALEESFCFEPHKSAARPGLRARAESAAQLSEEIAAGAELMIIPVSEITRLKNEFLLKYKDKIAVELPRVSFGGYGNLSAALESAKRAGVVNAVAGSPGALYAARSHGFTVHGDYGLNITNSVAAGRYESLGLRSFTASFELSAKQIAALNGGVPRGIIAYGYLPLMVMRACPIRDCKTCRSAEITDRRGSRFKVVCRDKIPELLNCVPLFLEDKLQSFTGIDFLTLYFTTESPEKCAEVFGLYKNGGGKSKPPDSFTRGLYFRGVL